MNPLLARELRVRFRDNRSFWLLLGLTAALCLLAGWIYADSVARFESADSGYGAGGVSYNFVQQRAHQTGRELFRFLAMGNVAAWLLIAPALTATGLAKERERGLLESLWLSPFKVRAQILGRLGATLCFLFILQVAVLPVYGIALLLGGVSPGEIGLATLVIGVTALFGASLGLWCSARVYRSANALGSVFVLIAVWSFIAYQQIYTITSSPSLYALEFTLFFSHPVAVLFYLLSPEELSRFTSPPFNIIDVLRFGLTFLATGTWLMLWSATRSASKPLPDLHWSQGNRILNGWRTQLDTVRRHRKERRERARAHETVAGALLYELPVEKFVRFQDPLLSREVRARFRVRQSGWLVSLLRLGGMVACGCFWLAIVYSAFDRTSRAGTAMSLLMGLLTLGILAVGVMSSTSFVRERESGTWEGLRLSLISPSTLVRSKWQSPVITFLYWSAPLWILLPLGVNWGGKAGVAWPWLLASAITALASLGAVSAWGLWISRRAPHSAAATSWTLATLLLVLAGVPALDNMVDWSWKVTTLVSSFYDNGTSASVYRPDEDEMEESANDENIVSIQFVDALVHAYNPFAAQVVLLDEASSSHNSYSSYTPATRLAVVLFHLVECGLLTFLLLRRITWQVTRPEA